jgi:hypothetical protein
VLLSPEAVAWLISWKDATAKEAQLSLAQQKAIDAAQLTFQTQQLATTCTADKSVLQSQLTDAQKQYDITEAQLKKVGSAPSATVWITVGFVGGVVLSALTVFAVSSAVK